LLYTAFEAEGGGGVGPVKWSLMVVLPVGIRSGRSTGNVSSQIGADPGTFIRHPRVPDFHHAILRSRKKVRILKELPAMAAGGQNETDPALYISDIHLCSFKIAGGGLELGGLGGGLVSDGLNGGN